MLWLQHCWDRSKLVSCLTSMLHVPKLAPEKHPEITSACLSSAYPNFRLDDCCRVLTSLCISGYHLGLLSSSIVLIAEDLGSDDALPILLATAPYLVLGAAAASLAAGQLADSLAPRMGLLLSNVPLIAGSLLCLLTPHAPASSLTALSAGEHQLACIYHCLCVLPDSCTMRFLAGPAAVGPKHSMAGCRL